MNDLAVLNLGREQLFEMFKAGELPDGGWPAIKGAGKYIAAGLIGGFADTQESQRRADTCLACRTPSGMPTIFWRDTCVEGTRAGYCGDPSRGEQSNPARCGCFVAVTVNGVLFAGAKPRVKGESCPQGKW